MRQCKTRAQREAVRIRTYEPEDFFTVSRLFCETVHSVNRKDYSEEQCKAWTDKSDGLRACRNRLRDQHTLIAEIGGEAVGFGSMDASGCLDLLYVAESFLRRGAASALCDALEENVPHPKTYASITAKPFFESRGYRVLAEREVDCGGILLKNFEMQKP